MVCAEMASIFTQTGGVYVFLKESFSPSVGFLWGWGMFWSIHSGIIAAIAVILARYVGYFIPLGNTVSKIVSVLVILVISAVNYLGVKPGSAMQTLFTLGKVVAIVVIVILGFTLGSRIPAHFVMDGVVDTGISIRHFFLALVAGLFAFGGWHMVTYNAEETLHPRKTIPRALMIGTLTVTLCYIALNAVYMYVLPLNVVASSKRIAADAADVLLGYGGGSFMSALVVFSTFGALSGIILCGPRVYYSMAKDGLLFRWIGAVHPRYHTPHRAIFIQAVWSSVLVATGTYTTLFTRVVYTEWIFFALMAFGLILLRRRSDVVRAYKIWGYPVIPIVFIISSLAIVTNQIISDPRESLFGLSLVFSGLPVYYLWAKKKRRSQTDDH
ncbi:MAG: amino acid permease, partial [Candidatus Aminicenantes bacterium]|jgi:APA family basic amino acid/polyamine antiporter